MGQIFNEEPVFFLMAIVGSALFLLKMALFFVGGDTEVDLDVGELDGADHVDGGDSFSLVSVQSILAFVMGAGWMGLACRREWLLNQMESIGVAATFGFFMMLLSSYLTFKLKGLNATPTFDLKKAVGLTGRAYTNIPQKGKGIGQVEITINGKLETRQALSDGDEIKAFNAIKVVSVDDSGNLIVKEN